mmetsp:Transcript_29720/g.64949  ORF Transcript_29720/g.64949 Transcript_29720/m.64949 type:complete len:266 (-) Transcript_29720:396-1193(-)
MAGWCGGPRRSPRQSSNTSRTRGTPIEHCRWRIRSQQRRHGPRARRRARRRRTCGVACGGPFRSSATSNPCRTPAGTATLVQRRASGGPAGRAVVGLPRRTVDQYIGQPAKRAACCPRKGAISGGSSHGSHGRTYAKGPSSGNASTGGNTPGGSLAVAAASHAGRAGTDHVFLGAGGPVGVSVGASSRRAGQPWAEASPPHRRSGPLGFAQHFSPTAGGHGRPWPSPSGIDHELGASPFPGPTVAAAPAASDDLATAAAWIKRSC